MVIQTRRRTYSSMYRFGRIPSPRQQSPSLPYEPSSPAIQRLRSIYATELLNRHEIDIRRMEINLEPFPPLILKRGIPSVPCAHPLDEECGLSSIRANPSNKECATFNSDIAWDRRLTAYAVSRLPH